VFSNPSENQVNDDSNIIGTTKSEDNGDVVDSSGKERATEGDV
jgi:hypothetical protein